MKRGQTLKAGHIIDQTKFSPYSPYETRANVKKQGHPTRNFDKISVRESLLVLRFSDNALTKSD